MEIVKYNNEIYGFNTFTIYDIIPILISIQLIIIIILSIVMTIISLFMIIISLLLLIRKIIKNNNQLISLLIN